MNTNGNDDLALARLLQLVSPSLPIGSYSYSQGIEWAVEAGWINNANDLELWLDGLIHSNMLYLELPLLKRMMVAWAGADENTIQHWSEYLLASRETAELRLEEINRGRAFYQILSSLDDTVGGTDKTLFKTQLACFSYACQSWQISFDRAACGLLWSWLENLVLSAVKIIPLGQTDGQTLIFKLSSLIPQLVDQANNIVDDDIGASSMALAIASAQHESQYSRLFRS